MACIWHICNISQLIVLIMLRNGLKEIKTKELIRIPNPHSSGLYLAQPSTIDGQRRSYRQLCTAGSGLRPCPGKMQGGRVYGRSDSTAR